MVREFVEGGIIFKDKDDAGGDIVRSTGDHDSDIIVHPPGANGVSVVIKNDVDVNVSLLPEINGVFEAPFISNASTTATSPNVITTWPFKIDRFKVRITLTGDTIFKAEVFSLRA